MLNLMAADNTPTPQAVAHAVLDEITKTHRLRPVTPPDGSDSGPRSWSRITVILTTALAVGTLVGVLGNAFFVGRTEYTVSETTNAITHEAMRQTLDRVDRTLNAQTQALTEMAKAVQAQAVEMATIKHRGAR
jgi:hypothetical protein